MELYRPLRQDDLHLLSRKAECICSTFWGVEGSRVTKRRRSTLNPSFSRFFTPRTKSFFFSISQLGSMG